MNPKGSCDRLPDERDPFHIAREEIRQPRVELPGRAVLQRADRGDSVRVVGGHALGQVHAIRRERFERASLNVVDAIVHWDKVRLGALSDHWREATQLRVDLIHEVRVRRLGIEGKQLAHALALSSLAVGALEPARGVVPHQRHLRDLIRLLTDEHHAVLGGDELREHERRKVLRRAPDDAATLVRLDDREEVTDQIKRLAIHATATVAPRQTLGVRPADHCLRDEAVELARGDERALADQAHKAFNGVIFDAILGSEFESPRVPLDAGVLLCVVHAASPPRAKRRRAICSSDKRGAASTRALTCRSTGSILIGTARASRSLRRTFTRLPVL